MEPAAGPSDIASTSGEQASSAASRHEDEPGIPVGEKWALVRRRLGWSLDLAAQRLGITSARLDEMEVGFRSIAPDMARELGETYGVEPERLERRPWSERIPPRFDAETQILWMGWLPIEIHSTGNEALLLAIADAIRTMRFLGEHEPVRLRESELGVLVPLFDLTDDQLDERLGRIFKLDQAEVLEVLNAIISALEATTAEATTAERAGVEQTAVAEG